MDQQRTPRQVTFMFFFLPNKPKEAGIFFSIIKIKANDSDEEELHYTFVEFDGEEFKLPVKEGQTFSVEAWCELIHPSLVMAPQKKIEPVKPKRIITPHSRFLPRRN